MIGHAQLSGGVTRLQKDRGALHLRRRAEGVGGHGKQDFSAGIQLGLHRKISKVACARLGDESRGDFCLHQEDGSFPVIAQLKKLFENRRSNVIRQIPRHGGGSPGREIGFQYVALDQHQPARVNGFTELLAQVVDQESIHLEGDNFLCAFQKAFRKRPLSRTNFDDQRTKCRVAVVGVLQKFFFARGVLCEMAGDADGGGDAVQNRFANEEMLS